jgi:hypothetical protein
MVHNNNRYIFSLKGFFYVFYFDFFYKQTKNIFIDSLFRPNTFLDFMISVYMKSV